MTNNSTDKKESSGQVMHDPTNPESAQIIAMIQEQMEGIAGLPLEKAFDVALNVLGQVLNQLRDHDPQYHYGACVTVNRVIMEQLMGDQFNEMMNQIEGVVTQMQIDQAMYEKQGVKTS